MKKKYQVIIQFFLGDPKNRDNRMVASYLKLYVRAVNEERAKKLATDLIRSGETIYQWDVWEIREVPQFPKKVERDFAFQDR